MDVLMSYTFQVVALGTVILSIASAVIGSVSVIKGQSLIGDAIGHSTFPGVVLAFMLFNVMETYILVVGAMVMGAVAFFLIQHITHESKIPLDSALALILSGFFGLGMALKSYVQGHSNYRGTQGIDDFIFGQAAYILKSDVYLIIVTSVIGLSIFFIFYNELKIYMFDYIYAKSIGINIKLINALILIMTLAIISVGLKAVGAILIVNILIAPTVIGQLWSNRYGVVLTIASIVGALSAFIGTYVSTAFTGIPTGPAIILALSFFVIVSMLFSPKGFISRIIRNKRLGGAL